MPLNALQILWVNFFSDSFPAISYAFEKDDNSLMHKPSHGKIQLFNPLMKFLILIIGLSTSLLLFFVYYVLLKLGYDETIVRTFIFAGFGTYSLIMAFPIRNLHQSIFSYPLFSNHYLTGGIFIGLILMALAIYWPILQNIFGTVSLSLPWIIAVLLISLVNISLIELAKWLFRTKSKHTANKQLVYHS